MSINSMERIVWNPCSKWAAPRPPPRNLPDHRLLPAVRYAEGVALQRREEVERTKRCR